MKIRNEKVLIVDDAKFTRSIIKSTLKNLGFLNIFEADSIHDAISVYRQIIPDLVTMDIGISGDQGLEGLNKIKQINPDSRIIVMSAASTHDNIIKAFSFGAAHFLSKPITVESITAAFEKVLSKPASINVVSPLNTQESLNTPNKVNGPAAKAVTLRLENEIISINCQPGNAVGRCCKCKTDAELLKNNQRCNIDDDIKSFIPCKHITVDVEQFKFILENSIFYIIPLSRTVMTRLNDAPLTVLQKYHVKSGDMVSFGTCCLKAVLSEYTIK
jgi:two-component system chemotaxis response regulator CheY